MFVCKNCGQTYPVYSNFCTKCGSNVLEEVADAPISAVPNNPAAATPAYADPASTPVVAPAYNAPVSNPAYNAPVSGPAYNAPVSGPAYGNPGYEAPTPYAASPEAAPSGGNKVKGIVGMALSIAGAAFAFIAFCCMAVGFDEMNFYSSHSANDAGTSGFIFALMFALPLGIVGRNLSGGAEESGFVSGISKTGKIVGLVAWICAAVIAFLSIFPMSY